MIPKKAITSTLQKVKVWILGMLLIPILLHWDYTRFERPYSFAMTEDIGQMKIKTEKTTCEKAVLLTPGRGRCWMWNPLSFHWPFSDYAWKQVHWGAKGGFNLCCAICCRLNGNLMGQSDSQAISLWLKSIFLLCGNMAKEGAFGITVARSSPQSTRD